MKEINTTQSEFDKMVLKILKLRLNKFYQEIVIIFQNQEALYLSKIEIRFKTKHFSVIGSCNYKVIDDCIYAKIKRENTKLLYMFNVSNVKALKIIYLFEKAEGIVLNEIT